MSECLLPECVAALHVYRPTDDRAPRRRHRRHLQTGMCTNTSIHIYTCTCMYIGRVYTGSKASEATSHVLWLPPHVLWLPSQYMAIWLQSYQNSDYYSGSNDHVLWLGTMYYDTGAMYCDISQYMGMPWPWTMSMTEVIVHWSRFNFIPLTYTKRHEKWTSHTDTHRRFCVCSLPTGVQCWGPVGLVWAFPHGPPYCFRLFHATTRSKYSTF